MQLPAALLQVHLLVGHLPSIAMHHLHVFAAGLRCVAFVLYCKCVLYTELKEAGICQQSLRPHSLQ